MPNSKIPQHIRIAVQQFPNSLRQKILDNERFTLKTAIEYRNVISIGASANFDPKIFLDTVRLCFSTDEVIYASDLESNNWEFRCDRSLRLPQITLSNSKEILSLTDSRALSLIPQDRNNWRADISSVWHLNNDLIVSLVQKSESEPLDIDDQQKAEIWIECTPYQFQKKLVRKFGRGIKFDDLIPKDCLYFEALAGSPKPTDGMKEFLAGNFLDYARSILNWDPSRGFSHLLKLSASPVVLEALGSDSFQEDAIRSAFETPLDRSNIFSSIALAEWGLLELKKRPWLEKLLVKFLDELLGEIGKEDRLNLSSQLVMAVDCLIVDFQILNRHSPSIRRQISIAQAAIIEDAILEAELDRDEVLNWLGSIGKELFYFQNLIDLVREPRWASEYISASQLRAEFAGRLMNAARRGEVESFGDDLKRVCFDAEYSIEALVELPRSYLPGPLEGSVDLIHEIPSELGKFIDEQLSPEEIDLSSFSALISAASIGHIAGRHAMSAAGALQRVNYQLQASPGDENLSAYMLGLAKVCAVSRSKELANELRVLSRVLRRTKAKGWSAESEFITLVTAAAAEEDPAHWASRLGEWLCELAAELDVPDAAQKIDRSLRQLWRLAPELRSSTTSANALLMAAANAV